MKHTSFKIQNLKAFGREAEFRLAPITIVCGPNSSGKSSAIQTLRLMRQTFRSSDPFNLQLNGSDIDLGTPELAFHKGNRNRPFIFEWSMRHPAANHLDMRLEYRSTADLPPEVHNAKRGEFECSAIQLNLRSGDETTAKAIKLVRRGTPKEENLEFGHTRPRAGRKRRSANFGVNTAAQFEFADSKSKTTFAAFTLSWWKRFVTNPSSTQMVKELGALLITERDILKAIKSASIRNFPGLLLSTASRPPHSEYITEVKDDPVLVKERLAELVLWFGFYALMDSTHSALSLSKHIAGLREEPQRFYSIGRDVGDNQIGPKGENIADVIWELEKSDQKINRWLNLLEIQYKLSLETIDSIAGRFLTLKLTDKKNGHNVTPKEVGLGISQVLPILTLILTDERKSTRGNKKSNDWRPLRLRTIEQPELHLHPRLQANLADIFIEAIQASQTAWILETHSEALILRLQRRIREKKLSPDSIAINYVQPGNRNGPSIKHIRLDNDGDFIDEWPDGFFEEGFHERFTR